MTILFSILLSPVFFIIYYAISEYIFPTKNAAVIFAFCAAGISVYVYYTIRTQVRQLNREKSEVKNIKKNMISQILLLDEKSFCNIFPKNSLTDNSYSGINEDKIIYYLRKNGCKNNIDIFSLSGVSKGGTDLLNLLGIKYKIHTEEEIIKFCESANLPEINQAKKESIIKRFISGIFSKEFRKFAIKYGIIISVVGIITPYMIYYIVFGGILFLYGVFSLIFEKISQQNQIPYPRF